MGMFAAVSKDERKIEQTGFEFGGDEGLVYIHKVSRAQPFHLTSGNTS